jgi:hypothetical protein
MKKITAIIFSLTISLNVFGQGNGALTGTVTDDNGAKVNGAQVVLTSSNGVHLNTSTDQAGTFEFKNLRSGSYFRGNPFYPRRKQKRSRAVEDRGHQRKRGSYGNRHGPARR